MAIHRMSEVFSIMIFTIMVIGSESSIPTGPHTQPQKISERITTRVESPSRLPIRFGSMMFPRLKFTTRKPSATSSATPIPYCRSPSRIGGNDARIEPMLGM